MKKVICKNEIHDTVIERFASDASGICRINGMTVFVPNALPREKIRVRIVKVLSTYAYGKIEEILLPSEQRTDPECPCYGRCGGCDTRHMNYMEELRMKTDSVNDTLSRIGHLDHSVRKVTESPACGRYRNKVSYSYANLNGRIVHGFYRERTHDVIPVSDCLLQPGTFPVSLLHLLSSSTITGSEHMRKKTGADPFAICSSAPRTVQGKLFWFLLQPGDSENIRTGSFRN